MNLPLWSLAPPLFSQRSLDGLSGSDGIQLHPVAIGPFVHRPGGKFGPVIRHDDQGQSVRLRQSLQHRYDPLPGDRRPHLEGRATTGSILSMTSFTQPRSARALPGSWNGRRRGDAASNANRIERCRSIRLGRADGMKMKKEFSFSASLGREGETPPSGRLHPGPERLSRSNAPDLFRPDRPSRPVGRLRGHFAPRNTFPRLFDASILAPRPA